MNDWDEYIRMREEEWIKQEGGSIDFGGRIGVVDFPFDKDFPSNDEVNLTVKNTYANCFYILESAKDSVYLEGGVKVNNPTYEEYSKGGFFGQVKTLLRKHEFRTPRSSNLGPPGPRI